MSQTSLLGAAVAGVLAGLSVGWSSCAAPPTLDEPRLANLPALVAAVEPARLTATVAEFVRVHLEDTPLPCDRFKVAPDHDLCHLTRDAARVLLRSKLEALGLAVTEHVETANGYTTVNVVAEQRGTTRPDEVIFVSAHYDAFYGGADDNTSGVAAMLEVARLLAPRRFERTIRYLGFDLEELGLIGSTRYVRATEAEPVTWAGGINFDCIAFRSSEAGSQSAPPGFAAPDTADFIAVVASADSRGLAGEVWSLNERLGRVATVAAIASPGASDSMLTGNLQRSDHAAFWMAGRPALFFTDTANFRNEHYHEPTDLPETLDPAFLAEVTRLSVASIAYWAGEAP